MTPRTAARLYAASLLQQQLAAAHVEGPDGEIGGKSWYGSRIVADTFAKAPPVVARALETGRLDGEAVAEEMARLADELCGTDHEVALWALVLGHPSGVGLDFFGGLLTARRNEDGRFAVAWGEGQAEEEALFDNADAAARFFRDKRVELQLGYDFERG